MDIRNLDFWAINCLETSQICNSFNELQLVYLDWNDYLFKQHSAEDFTIITAEDLELNTKCLSHDDSISSFKLLGEYEMSYSSHVGSVEGSAPELIEPIHILSPCVL